MTLFYQTNTWTSQPPPTEKAIDTWKHAADKSNWRGIRKDDSYINKSDTRATSYDR